MNADLSDTNVQAMRDQGIRDATNGHPAFVWMFRDSLAYIDGAGDLVTVPTSEEFRQQYREAFAYHRAYVANRLEVK